MTDQNAFERIVADSVRSIGPVAPSDGAHELTSTRVRQSRQDPEWLALIKEPPMRSNSRPVVGSPTVRVAAILGATLLLALALAAAGAGASRLLAAGPIIVDASGGGDYTTIQEAVDAAQSGDEVLVRPGDYSEQVTVDGKDITLRGDGPVEDIVVRAEGETLFMLTDSDAVIADLTLRGDESSTGMVVSGGAPTIEGLHFDGTGLPYGLDTAAVGGSSLDLLGTTATVTDNRFSGGGEIRFGLDSAVAFERNELADGPHIYLQQPGEGSILHDNTIRNTYDRAIGLFAPSTMEISGNTIEGAGGDGITVGWNSAAGHDPVIKDNDISGAVSGIRVFRGGRPTVEANTLHGNEMAILSLDADASYIANQLSTNGTGISLQGTATLDGNSIVGGRTGLVLYGADTKPVLTGNTVCDNDTNVVVSETTNTPALEYDDSNEICEDAAE